MRVLLATTEYPPAHCGGIGVFYRELAHELVNQGAAVCVFAADPAASTESCSQEEGVEVRRALAPARKALRVGPLRLDGRAVYGARVFSAAARQAAAEFQPDVVETHDWAAPLWRPPARPFVVRMHGSSSVLAAGRGRRPGRLMRLLERRMLKRADALVAVSDWVAARSAEVFRLPERDMRTIANGVDVDRFRPAHVQRGAEVVFAGTLRGDKGVVELLQALETVLCESPAATATLAGGPDGWHELPPVIRSRVERLHMLAPGRVRLLGRVDRGKLAELYGRAGACVFPSHVEAFGLACVEAMSCGAPVVASRLGAAAEIVEDGRNGLLIDPRGPEQIAAALSRLLEQPALAAALGAQARRTAVERYSMHRTAERTLALYHELGRAKRPWLNEDAA